MKPLRVLRPKVAWWEVATWAEGVWIEIAPAGHIGVVDPERLVRDNVGRKTLAKMSPMAYSELRTLRGKPVRARGRCRRGPIYARCR